MDLRSRLNALTLQQKGTSPPTESTGPTLAERIARMATGARKTATDEDEIAQRLGGVRIANGVVRIDRKYPLDQLHGKYAFAQIHSAPLEFLGLHYRTGSETLVFLDTETSGLAGGAGTIAFLLGMARIAGNTLELRQWFLLAFRGESAMLEDALSWLRQDVSLVSFNGKTFDMPLLAGRYRQNRMADPFPGLLHLDLVHPLRRAFSGIWENCRLQTAEQHLLNLYRNDDLPGALMPEIWSRFLRHNSLDAIPAVLEHNRIDILSLPALATALAHFYMEPATERCNLLAIAQRHLSEGRRDHAARLLAEYEPVLNETGLLALARLQRLGGRDDEALRIWQALAERGSAMATEKLAKYYEHARRDYTVAFRYACLFAEATESELAHRRLTRLQNKLARFGNVLL